MEQFHSSQSHIDTCKGTLTVITVSYGFFFTLSQVLRVLPTPFFPPSVLWTINHLKVWMQSLSAVDSARSSMEKLRKEIIAPSADDIVAILQDFAEAEIDFTPYVNEKKSSNNFL